MQRSIDVVTRVTRWATVVAAVCIFVLLLLNVIDIVGSKWFGWSIKGCYAASEELMVFLTVLAFAYVELERGHIRITILERRLAPAGRFAFQLVQYVVGMLVMGFLTWRVFLHFQYVVKIMQLKTGTFIPVWPANLAIVIGFGLLTLVWMLLLAKTLSVGLRQ